MNEEQILNNIPKITIGVNVFIDFEYEDTEQETLQMSQSQLIDFIESELFNQIGIDSLDGATDVALRHYTYETGNDFIQELEHERGTR